MPSWIQVLWIVNTLTKCIETQCFISPIIICVVWLYVCVQILKTSPWRHLHWTHAVTQGRLFVGTAQRNAAAAEPQTLVLTRAVTYDWNSH